MQEKSVSQSVSQSELQRIYEAAGGEAAAAGCAPSAYRFYKSTLRPLYESCALPTLEPFPSPNALPVHGSTYRAKKSRNGVKGPFVQRILERKDQAHDPRPDLVAPFARTPQEGEAVGTASRKGQRKRPLQGQLRSYKVRMVPTTEQKRELKRCFSAARDSYNWTVAEMQRRWDASKRARANGEQPEKHWGSMYSLRKAYLDSGLRPDWSKSVNRTFVVSGVQSAVCAYKSNWEKQKIDPSHHFEVKFRSIRRTKTEAIAVAGDGESSQKQSPLLRFERAGDGELPRLRAECLAHFGSNLKEVGGIRLQDKKHVVEKLLKVGNRLPEECAILWDKRTDDWHFKFVYDLPVLPDPDPGFETKRVVATDPGVRNFMTFYCPRSGSFGRLFERGRGQITERCLELDARASALALKANEIAAATTAGEDKRELHRELRTLRRRNARERKRLRGFVEAGHYAAAGFLLRHHEVVVCPKLETKAIAESGTIGSNAVRAMLTFSHYKFQQRLQSAAFRFPGRVVVDDGGEPGTSRTCTHCGRWKQDLGAAEVFHCPACGVKVDRDLAGARNNFFAAWQKHAAAKTAEARKQQRKRQRTQSEAAASISSTESTVSASASESESESESPSDQGGDGVTLSPGQEP
jgi:transposase